jgi:hypothetical protein
VVLRDLEHLTQVLLNLTFFMTPTLYGEELVPQGPAPALRAQPDVPPSCRCGGTSCWTAVSTRRRWGGPRSAPRRRWHWASSCTGGGGAACRGTLTPSSTFRGVSKSYVLHGPALGLKHTLLHLPSVLREARSHPTFLALDGVDFTVGRGECFGIHGPNGSGKSTLLGLAAGVLRPTRGEVVVRRPRLPAARDGAGFHGDLTGRENALLNGMILGLSRREALAQLPGIRAFADIGSYFDEPIRTYSAA